MVDLATAQQVCWNLSILLRALLLCLVLWRKNARSFPFFVLYLSANLAKSLLLNLNLNVWHLSEKSSFLLAWGSQSVVICTRAFAVAEICRLLLAGYRGIWALAQRILLSCVVVVLLYAYLVSKHQWNLAILGANRAVELAIAVVIVVLLVFLRHYQIIPEPLLRTLALGFCLFSCFEVINYTILEHWLWAYENVWNFLDIISYLFCMIGWTWALRESFPRVVRNPALLPGAVYRQLSPEINQRLRQLDEQLSHFWGVRAPRS
jgi:hypothetical protein